MSNFTNKVHEQIMMEKFLTPKEIFAFLHGVFKTSGFLSKVKKDYFLEIIHQDYNVLLKMGELIQRTYGDTINIKYKTTSNKTKEYTATLESSVMNRALVDCYIAKVLDNKKLEILLNYPSYQTVDEISAFLSAVFLSCGSIYLPEIDLETDSKSSGYHLELKFQDEHLSRYVMNMLAQFDILTKKIERSEVYVLYLKDSNMISDFLALLKAEDIVLELSNLVVQNSIKNKINRQNNCMIANIDKTINASEKQLSAIRNIDEKIGLKSLDEKLYEVAKIRIENPEYSLAQIAAALDNNISKSGIKHRLNNIIRISDSLDEVK